MAVINSAAIVQIPYARGRQRSLSKEKVIEIAQSLSNKGHYEIVLTGIHTGRYQDGDTRWQNC